MILITGGGGFLGLNIARSLANKGQNVLIVQRHAIAPHPLLAPHWDKRIRQAAGSVLDWPFVLSLTKQYPIESIIHGAFDTSALTDPHALKTGLHQLVQTELEGSKNLLEIARIAGLRRFTFLSSVDCYRGSPDECEVWQEDAYLPPVSFSPIGNCKRAAEQLGFLYSKVYSLSFVALRVGRVYGPGSTRPNPMRTMIESAARAKPVELLNVPENLRVHPVYAKDMAEAASLVHLAHSLRHHIYNVADGSNPTMSEIAQIVRSIVPNAQIRLGPVEQRTPPYRGIDVKRIGQEFGTAFRDLRAGIGDYIAELNTGLTIDD